MAGMDMGGLVVGVGDETAASRWATRARGGVETVIQKRER
jgi:hypothetical protein